jgi:hypothetical protein
LSSRLAGVPASVELRMTADERTEAEVRADRALRRGELSTALSLFQAIAAAFPDDPVIALKLSRIRETLQPMELSHAKTRPVAEAKPVASGSVESAEACAAKGDYGEAIAIYRKALERRPDSDLIKERLAELFQIAQSLAPPVTLSGGAAGVEGSASVRSAGATLSKSDVRPRAHGSPEGSTPPPAPLTPNGPPDTDPFESFAPPDADPFASFAPVAADPVPTKDAAVSSPRMLSDLLDQISRRRRGRPQKG